MDYKEKYEHALARAKEILECSPNPDARDVKMVLSFFPELKESEDEKIVKELLTFFRESMHGGHILTNKEYDSWIAWLEKQGEQKPADKVESKFNVGDWCIDNEDGTIFQIVKVLDNTYTYKTNEGNEYSCTHYSLENDARLWTIQDAKSGDVFACPNDAGDRDVVFIFKNINSDEGWVFCFCASDANGSFCTNNDYVGNSNSTNISPATKEQRDLLFQKMKEAGYDWDGERKELKKIEQKPAWSEEDEKGLTNTIIMLKEGASLHFNKKDITKTVDWLKSLKERIKE